MTDRLTRIAARVIPGPVDSGVGARAGGDTAAWPARSSDYPDG